MIHSLVIGFTLALASGAGFEYLVMAILFHQLFEGQPVLAILFALTTPADPLRSLRVWWRRSHKRRCGCGNENRGGRVLRYQCGHAYLRCVRGDARG
jgi:hypothetical protein